MIQSKNLRNLSSIRLNKNIYSPILRKEKGISLSEKITCHIKDYYSSCSTNVCYSAVVKSSFLNCD